MRATSWYVVYVVRGSGCVVRGSGTGYVVRGTLVSLLVLGNLVAWYVVRTCCGGTAVLRATSRATWYTGTWYVGTSTT